MESIEQWFQDWSDACEYAKECVPDLSFVVPQEPFSALASIAAACFVIWWWNERQIDRQSDYERRTPAGDVVDAVRTGELELMLDQIKNARAAPKKEAA